MCGFVGFIAWSPVEDIHGVVTRMNNKLSHRGPDDEGVFTVNSLGLAFGHRRLSIIDLTAEGRQPMPSKNGRFHIVFNGEIYNHLALKKELSSSGFIEWTGSSDTEVLLACIQCWGLEKTLTKIIGMFSFALWDGHYKSVTLVRDRLGEKPLYYGLLSDRLIFSSELQPIESEFSRELSISREALTNYMQFSYIPAPLSIYSQINKLEPGHFITVFSLNDPLEPQSYWQLEEEKLLSSRSELSQMSHNEVVDLVHDQLAESVKLQMVSDVPTGAFLSGGIDSTLIVSLMKEQSKNSVKTYTLGFASKSFDEAPYAKAIAEYLNTDHTEMYVSASDAENIIPSLASIYDEPFADSSQIPTILVSRLARQYVTVSLSGDGGDELFSGYPRYDLASDTWNKVTKVPPQFRSAISKLISLPSSQQWDNILSRIPFVDPQVLNGRRIQRLSNVINCLSLQDFYINLVSQWNPRDNIVLGSLSCNPIDIKFDQRYTTQEFMRIWDLLHYLPDDLLVKVDRASMSFGLESRAPFLDHRLVELAFAIPQKIHTHNRMPKCLLRSALNKYVPSYLFERPKAGFAVPLADWLRGPLRDWAHSLLDPSQLENQGFLDSRAVKLMWKEHLSGKYDRSPYLWNVLMFQSWLEHRH